MYVQRLIKLRLYVITTDTFDIRHKLRFSPWKRYCQIKFLLPTQHVATVGAIASSGLRHRFHQTVRLAGVSVWKRIA